MVFYFAMSIISRCKIIKNLAERRAKVTEELTLYSRPSMEDYGVIPNGFYYPHSHWPMEREIEKTFTESDDFFSTIDSWFEGSEKPDIVLKLATRYKSNKQRMIPLMRLSNEKRYALPTHEFPPFFENFDASVREMARRSSDVSDYIFQPNLLASGGFADLYRIRDIYDNDFVLKLYHSQYKRGIMERDFWHLTVGEILRNLVNRKSVLAQNPFIPLQYVSESGFYIMDYARDSTVRSILNSVDLRCKLGRARTLKKDGWKDRAVKGYGDMLTTLHHAGLVFMDHCWSSVFLGESCVQIGDLDFISSLDDANSANSVIGKRPHHVYYASREHRLPKLPYTIASELESFALMIDHIYNGTTWRSVDTWESSLLLDNEMMLNNKKYPSQRKRKLPFRLQKVVSGLLQYPRDDSITLEDVVREMK